MYLFFHMPCYYKNKRLVFFSEKTVRTLTFLYFTERSVHIAYHVYFIQVDDHYTCPYCGKRCQEYQNIRKHIRAFHLSKR